MQSACISISTLAEFMESIFTLARHLDSLDSELSGYAFTRREPDGTSSVTFHVRCKFSKPLQFKPSLAQTRNEKPLTSCEQEQF